MTGSIRLILRAFDKNSYIAIHLVAGMPLFKVTEDAVGREGWISYCLLHTACPRRSVRDGLVGRGIYADEGVSGGRGLSEYIGERIKTEEADCRKVVYGLIGIMEEYMADGRY